jgi:hypothetical protein
MRPYLVYLLSAHAGGIIKVKFDEGKSKLRQKLDLTYRYDKVIPKSDDIRFVC